MLHFEVGQKYSRADIKEMAGLSRTAKGGPWDTGIAEHEGEHLLFANIGAEGRTGHDYANAWEGSLLRWYHKTSSRLDWPSVQRLLGEESRVHAFWRSSNSDPFTYAGCARAVEYHEVPPVSVLWALLDPPPEFNGPDEVQAEVFVEGAVREIRVNAYERNPAARDECIAYYGASCVICGFNFEDRYGSIGRGYIHVHHIVPISDVGRTYTVNPVADLRPLCPNCHAMVHQRTPPYSVEKVRKMLRN